MTTVATLPRGADEALVADIVRAALAAGELERRDDDSWTPRRAPMACEAAAWRAWGSHGFVPFHVKPCSTPTERPALAALLRALRRMPDLRYVPTWACPDWTVSLFLPDACTLADDTTRSRAATVEICRDSLGRFLADEPLLRSALSASGYPNPPEFPLARRWQTSLQQLAATFGGRASADPPPAAQGSRSAWTARCLFYDPKPSNYLRVDRAWSARIDFDMLYMTSPTALQVALAYFSHPICGVSDTGNVIPTFEAACRAGAGFGLHEAELHLAIGYHLTRNFAASSTDAMTRSRGSEKADGMAAAIQTLARVCEPLGAAGLQRAAAIWLAAQGQ
jgi:hypothetical protein